MRPVLQMGEVSERATETLVAQLKEQGVECEKRDGDWYAKIRTRWIRIVVSVTPGSGNEVHDGR